MRILSLKSTFSSFLLFFYFPLFCQVEVINDNRVGIGTSTPHPSAKLHIHTPQESNGSYQGLLIPRMTLSQKLSISEPADGLLVFVQDIGSSYGFWYWDDRIPEWVHLKSGSLPSGGADGQVLATDGIGGYYWTDGSGAGSGINLFNSDGTISDAVRMINLESGILDINNGRIELSDNFENVFVGDNAGLNSNNSPSSLTHIVLPTDRYIASEYSVGLGSMALQQNYYGRGNIAIGYKAMLSNEEGDLNTGIGCEALQNHIHGEHNVAIGYSTGFENISGSGNVFLGSRAGFEELGSNKLYIANTATELPLIYGEFGALPENSLLRINGQLHATNHIIDSDNSNGTNSQVLGRDNGGVIWRDIETYPVGGSNGEILTSDGNGGSFWAVNEIGWSLDGNALNGNEVIGSTNNQPFKVITNGIPRITIDETGRIISSFNQSKNIVIGENAGNNFMLGDGNIILGEESGSELNYGTLNTFIGKSSGSITLNGGGNTFVGHFSGIHNIEGAANAYFGLRAGYNNMHGFFNSSIGYQSAFTIGSHNNSSSIGSFAICNASNKIRLGSNAVTEIESAANNYTMSDARFKSNITENIPGIDFISKLRPVSYNFEAELADGHLMQGVPDSILQDYIKVIDYENAKQIRRTGFLAQEVEEACDEIGYDFDGLKKADPNNSSSNYSLAYASFVVPLVKAVQEQQSIIDNQDKVIERQNSELGELKNLVNSLILRIENIEKGN